MPTVGRIVHFYPPSTERENAEYYAAIVTAVASPNVVSLATFGPRSLYFHSDVPIGQGDSDAGAHWRWPPRVG